MQKVSKFYFISVNVNDNVIFVVTTSVVIIVVL